MNIITVGIDLAKNATDDATDGDGALFFFANIAQHE